MDKMGDTNGIPPNGIIYTGTRDELQRKLRARDDRITQLEEELNAAVAAEREACGKIADEFQAIAPEVAFREAASLIAAAIRARGEK